MLRETRMIATSRWKKLVTIGASATLAIAIPVCLLVYLLIQEPPYYSQVNDLSPEHRALESRQFMQQTTAIVNQVENQAAWSGVFRDMQLNAWLASDFARKHAEVLPEGITEPRVSFCDGVLSLAFRWQRGPVTIVVSASGQVWLPEPNFLAFELRSAQAGRLPIPKAYVIRSVTEAARSAGLDLNWKRHESQPVALLQFNS